MCTKLAIGLALVASVIKIVICYEVPEAKLEAIYPEGLRVSIPGFSFYFYYFIIIIRIMYYYFIIPKKN